MAVENGELIGYLRILNKGVSYKGSFYRESCCKKEYRRKKLGLEIINKGIDFIINTLQEKEVRISAQVYAKNLYKKAGFVEVSEEYLEDDIPHVEMLYSGK